MRGVPESGALMGKNTERLEELIKEGHTADEAQVLLVTEGREERLYRAQHAADPDFNPDWDQGMAIFLSSRAPVVVITGGPGRGKTACLKAALPYLGDVALCAPSGKAARRMAELTGYPAGTVHRLLGLTPEAEQGAFHAGNPLPYDTVVVDEASTLDIALGSMLLDACDPTRTRVVFIGDVDQLPSVGPGQVLHDLIESGVVPVVRLKTMHRAAKESWVCRQAEEILKGRIDLTSTHDFELVESDEELVARTVDVAQQLVESHGADNVQVVVPMNVGEYGAKALNPALQDAFNPKPSSAPWFGSHENRIYADDFVVCISNDYDKAVFNGETGRVLFVGDSVIVDFMDREVTYATRGEASEFLRLSYALTVHKMQGSESPWIVLVLHESHGPLLSRKMLYTAVTRAKQGVVIVGQRSAVYRAVSRSDTTSRRTRLRSRITEVVEDHATMEE